MLYNNGEVIKMVRCNLSVLLAERKLKISKVAADTGISRTTLTALFYNHSQGIQFDTLNTLCSYLSVSPSQLVSWIPIDVKVKRLDVDKDLNNATFSFGVTQGGREEVCEIFSMLQVTYSKGYVDGIAVDLCLWDEEINPPEVAEENALLKKIFRQIPTTFLHDIEYEIFDELVGDYHLREAMNNEDTDPVDFRITWPPELRPQM